MACVGILQVQDRDQGGVLLRQGEGLVGGFRGAEGYGEGLRGGGGGGGGFWEGVGGFGEDVLRGLAEIEGGRRGSITGDCEGYFLGSETKSLLSFVGLRSRVPRKLFANWTSDMVAEVRW